MFNTFYLMNPKKLKFYRLKPVRAIVLLTISILLLLIGYTELFNSITESTKNWFAIVGHSLLLFPLIEMVSFKNRVIYNSNFINITLNNWNSHRISLKEVSSIEFFDGILYVHLHTKPSQKIDLKSYIETDIYRLMELFEQGQKSVLPS